VSGHSRDRRRGRCAASHRVDRVCLAHKLRKSFIATLLLAACAPAADAPPVAAFWNELRILCGRTFEGRAVEVTALDSAVLGQRLVLSAWQCWAEELRFAFQVGDDHSRVWLIRAGNDGLSLIHDNRLADGAAAEFTNYGGPAIAGGTATRQDFTPDTETRIRIPSSAGAVWTLEIVPRERFTYAFTAAGGGRFRVDFDLTRAVERPPSPWGWTRRDRPPR